MADEFSKYFNIVPAGTNSSLKLSNEEEMLTIEEVAIHYDLKPDTVRRKVRGGQINAIRIGRV